MFKFMNTVSITLVKADNNGMELDYDRLLQEAADVFGGYTLTDQTGGWYSEEQQKLMIDYSSRLDLCFSDFGIDEELVIINFVEWLFNEADQEAVFVAFDGKPFIVAKDQAEDFQQFLVDTFIGGGK